MKHALMDFGTYRRSEFIGIIVVLKWYSHGQREILNFFNPHSLFR